MMYALSEWLVYAVIAMTVCMLSQLLPYELSICTVAAGAILPEVLETAGVDFFHSLSVRHLEDRAVSWLVDGKWWEAVLLTLLVPVLVLGVCQLWQKGKGRKNGSAM